MAEFKRSEVLRQQYPNNGRHMSGSNLVDLMYNQFDGLDDKIEALPDSYPANGGNAEVLENV